MQPRNHPFWLASYPKSGNTWVRFLLTQYALDRPVPGPVVQRLVPDLHEVPREQVRDNAGKLGVKTHYLCSPELPFVGEVRTAVYVVRNPLDVLASSLNHNLLYLLRDGSLSDDDVPAYRASFVADFLRHGGYSHWVKDGFGTVCQNVTSWADNDLGLTCLTVRYEDLLADTAGVVTRIVEFLGLPGDPDRVARAVQMSSFQALRELEEAEISARATDGVFYREGAEPAYSQGIRFVNRGRAGNWQSLVSVGQLRQACDVFGPVLDRFGYLSETVGLGRASHREQVGELTRRLAAQKCLVAALREELAAQRASYAALHEHLLADRAELIGLRGHLAAHQESLAAQRASYAALHEHLLADRAELIDLRGHLAAHQESLAALHRHLADERAANAALHEHLAAARAAAQQPARRAAG